MHICSIGECMIELANSDKNNYILGYAGDTANTAIYLSRLGAKSTYFTAVGRDKLSQKMISFFKSEKVLIDNVYLDNKKTAGLYLIQNKNNGEKNFFYWRKNSAARSYFENINFDTISKKIIKFDALYFSGITLSIYDSKNLNLFSRLLSLAKKNDVKIYFDFNVRLNNWKNKKIAKEKIVKFSKMSDVLFFSNEDLINLNIRNYKNFILKHYKKKLVIYRLGNGKIVICDKGEFIEYNLDFKNKVKDTTGCGDAFNASFVYNFNKKNKIIDCLNMAHKLGKDVAKTKGAIIKKENFNLHYYAV